jgi:uncharacterized protein (DUF433 family)
MTYPASPYVEQRGTGLYIAGTRVSFDSVVYHFQMGKTPPQIVEAFPSILLSHAYGAVAYYLEYEALVKEYLAEGDRIAESVPPLSQQDPELFARLEAARLRLNSKTA